MKTQKIAIGGRRLVSPENVILLIADINYTQFFLVDGSKIMVATPLKTLESRFQEHNFFRSHKSYLINMKFVKSYFEKEQNTFIQMQNNKTVLLSRRRRRSFEEIFHSSLHS